MVLVDTSIWVEHIRTPNRRLFSLLETGLVRMHPWVVGELACGNLGNRKQMLFLFRSMPQAAVATDNEVLHFIDKNRISGKGIGYVDMHLLAAAALGSLKIWTRDRRMHDAAHALGMAFVASE